MQYPVIWIGKRHSGEVLTRTFDTVEELSVFAEKMGGDNWEWENQPTEDEYTDAIGHDLSTSEFLNSQDAADEAMNRPNADPKWWAALCAEMRVVGWLADEEDDDEEDDEDDGSDDIDAHEAIDALGTENERYGC